MLEVSALVTVMHSALGDFELHRYPLLSGDLLQAWDAADELLLDEMADANLQGQRLLLVNDGFGALGVALHAHEPCSWSDSWLAHQGLLTNLQRNGLATEAVERLPSTETPALHPDWVLIKAPKSLALFEEQLIRLQPMLSANCQLLVAGMVKAMPRAIWSLLEKLIGPTRTGLAKKKARVIHVTPNPGLAPAVSPYPLRWPLEATDYTLVNHANVFSRQQLDIGTRFMLQHLPACTGQVIDLGCGNGVLGLMIAARNPDVRLHFVDESYMAVASARATLEQLDHGHAVSEFHVGDGLQAFEAGSADIIVCNPPFHQSNAVSTQQALAMFRQAARVLRPTGELWVVGNRHLGYHSRLQRGFARVSLVASNRKFVILRATQPRHR